MINWRIYYDDGSTFDNAMGSPSQAPGYGVICIIQFHPENGRTTLLRWDWYYWNGKYDCWFGSDQMGLMDQLCHDTDNHIQGVRQGRTVPNNIFNEIVMRASEDDCMPVETACAAIDDQSKFTKERGR